jgi:hypothetical protein
LARGRARGKVVAKGWARGHVLARGRTRGKVLAIGRARGHVVTRGLARGKVLAKGRVLPFSLTKYCVIVLKDKEYFGIAGHDNHLSSSIRIQNQTFHYQLWSSPALRNHN